MKDYATCFIIRHSISIKSLSLLKVSKMLNKLKCISLFVSKLLSTPVDMARSYMRARLPWGSLSVNNSEFWSPSSAGTQLLKEGTPFSYNAGNLSSSKVHQKGNNLNCGVGQPHPCVSEVARSGSYITWCCSEHQHQNQNEFKKFYKVLIYICCQDLLTDHHHSEREKGSTIVFKQ
ncbi:hypothetical protein YC2023_031618 [Brassica napus]